MLAGIMTLLVFASVMEARRAISNWVFAGIAVAAIFAVFLFQVNGDALESGFNYHLTKPVDWTALENILRQLPANGGVVMVTFVPGFLSPRVAAWNKLQTAEEDRLKLQHPNDAAAVKAGVDAWTSTNPAPRATVTDVADHIDHIRQVAGIDHIGLGGDFDGITAVPLGMEDVSTYPSLTAELLRRGYKDDDLRKILGQNILRVMRTVEGVSKKLQAERGPSVLLFEGTK